MSIAILCVLFAGLMPYLWIGYAKISGRVFDNHAPRLKLAKLEGAPARAHWAHLNAFEAFPFFAAAIAIALFQGVEESVLDTYAIVFVIARLLHGVFYILDWSTLRSLAWAVGLLVPVGLLIQAA